MIAIAGVDSHKWKVLSFAIQLLVNLAILDCHHGCFEVRSLQLGPFLLDFVSFYPMWFPGSSKVRLRALLALSQALIAQRTKLSFSPRWSPKKVTSMTVQLNN